MAFATRPPFCVLILIHVTLIGIMVNGTGADLIRDCVNVNVTSCIGRYADIYDAFVSDENSYKIQAALYPPKNSSSVRVFVNLNVLNRSRTDASKENYKADVAEYTWSLKCLYAALPAYFLEILSLGSILVTPRTQKLNITIPHFCCNVSVEERQKWIEDVLAAVSRLSAIRLGFYGFRTKRCKYLLYQVRILVLHRRTRKRIFFCGYPSSTLNYRFRVIHL